jgi:hypothetical protein
LAWIFHEIGFNEAQADAPGNQEQPRSARSQASKMTRTKNDLRRNVVDLDQAARPESRRVLHLATGALSNFSAKSIG